MTNEKKQNEQLAVVLHLDKEKSQICEFIPKKGKHAVGEIREFVEGRRFRLGDMSQMQTQGWICFVNHTTAIDPEFNIPAQFLLENLGCKKKLLFGNAVFLFRYPECNKRVVDHVKAWMTVYEECGVSSPRDYTDFKEYRGAVDLMKTRLKNVPNFEEACDQHKGDENLSRTDAPVKNLKRMAQNASTFLDKLTFAPKARMQTGARYCVWCVICLETTNNFI
jgi:hypothetical protein